jgi:hypothetical protein
MQGRAVTMSLTTIARIITVVSSFTVAYQTGYPKN